MAQHAVGRDFGKGDLGDELRFDPVRAAHRRARRLDGRRLALEPVEPLAQIEHRVGIEAGADLAGIDEPVGTVHAEQQRAEAALLVARRPADDHEFLPLGALDLQPGPGAPAAIGRVGPLRDDAFIALAAHRLEQLLAAADDMLGELQLRVGAVDQRPQALLALDIGQPAEILAVQFEQVEGEEDHVAAVRDRILERGKARLALPEGDDLAVDQRIVDRRASAAASATPGNFVGPVEAGAGIDLRLAAADRDQQPIAVIFDLVEPAAAGGHAVDQRASWRSRNAGNFPSPRRRPGPLRGLRATSPLAGPGLRGPRNLLCGAPPPGRRSWFRPPRSPPSSARSRRSSARSRPAHRGRRPRRRRSCAAASSRASPCRAASGGSAAIRPSSAGRSSMKWRWPFSRSFALLPSIGDQVPVSHSITVPPPYSPSGIVPSKSA